MYHQVYHQTGVSKFQLSKFSSTCHMTGTTVCGKKACSPCWFNRATQALMCSTKLMYSFMVYSMVSTSGMASRHSSAIKGAMSGAPAAKTAALSQKDKNVRL